VQSLPPRPKATGRTRDLVIAADQAIYFLSRHWLFFANLVVAIFAGLPLLAPFLMSKGLVWPAQIIYVAYRVQCHQRPERSFFPFGYQMAYCQRDTATYAVVLLAGIAYSFLRPKVKPLRLWQAIPMVAPMAVDGTGQFFGLWTSVWWSRVITGGLFGLALVWFVYPYIEQGLSEARASIEAKFKAAGIPLRAAHAQGANWTKNGS